MPLTKALLDSLTILGDTLKVHLEDKIFAFVQKNWILTVVKYSESVIFKTSMAYVCIDFKLHQY